MFSRTRFVLASAPGVEPIDAAKVFSNNGMSATLGVGNDVELLGGSISFESPGAVELTDLLPSAVVIKAESASATSLAWFLNELDRELLSSQVGAFAMCNDLMRMIFAHALRHHIMTADVADPNWLGGLRDSAIAPVLRAIHRQPEKIW